ncbi:glycoside hydrolase family 105 protein [Muribaculum gordoncarteri]|jgi:rhamnogalacturonyl hydrolase YesR|uniref:Glycoside hydrolase family 88 protein n=4 Tax=Muribaculum TaxID=1918540 RepID=A0A4P7VCV4_9BACT|nr:glycoside hydrolase family 88 protein [Muribaculum gordoncarteri]QCD34464.1 glycoside hydrolase family 88 protein [Muribaculum gordoncarteri]
MSRINIFLLSGLVLASCSSNKQPKEVEINDSTTPLHLLQPDYTNPYKVLSVDSVKADIDRVFSYIDSVTPARVVNEEDEVIDDLTNLPDDAKLNQGTYRLTSYEWGVMYMALLDAYNTLGDAKYKDYVSDRIGFLAKAAPAFAELASRTGRHDGQMRQVIAPATLDDAGAMSAAFMRAAMADSTLKIGDIIERYYDIVENHTYRLADGTIARNRPHHNSVWLDDMFMALPSMAARSAYTNDPKQLDEAARIAGLFIDRMWIPEKGIFRHGYVEGLEQEPSMAWGRANGWAILTMCQLLDAMPENHPQRAKILSTIKEHIKGLSQLQGRDGFWHQLLDRNDSYEETSATAIFAYCIAHAVNQGWVEAVTYGPVAQLAWEAVASKINDKGEVEGVCVGTGMGFDPAYYYYRPVSVKAAHGYGPVIWAGSEIIKMLNSSYPRLNDSAIHYYNVDPEATVPIFSLDENGKATEVLH